ncbi:MAG: lysozyme [Dyella sp.]
MQPSNNARALVMASEGLRLSAYPDPGTGAAPWTIGYGSTKGVRAGLVITEAEADARLDADLADAAAIVIAAVRVPLNQNQFDALVSFVFNVGPGRKGGKSGFVVLSNGEPSTMLRMLNSGGYMAAARQFTYWTMAGGVTLPGLVTRRAAERALFERPA